MNDPNDRKVPKISVAVYSPNRKQLKKCEFLNPYNLTQLLISKQEVYLKYVCETIACDHCRPFKWNLLIGDVMLNVFQYHIKLIWVIGRELKSTKLTVLVSRLVVAKRIGLCTAAPPPPLWFFWREGQLYKG